MIDKIKRIIRKNQAEATASLTGKMLDFIYGIKQFKDIPVFCFHSARYPLFEKQLQFLNENGYKTLTADELYERHIDKNYKNNGKEIVITFDDGMASVWTVAYPLLKKYQHKIISFILPALMKEEEGVGFTIDDVVSEQEKIDLSNRDYSNKPLCNWNVVKLMHESGLVDFHSHGINHALISTSPKIVDFIYPNYDVYHYGNIHVPMYRDADGNDTRENVLGHPVYQHTPRLSGRVRYFDSIELRQACAAYVAERKGQQFFLQPDWRHKLKKVVVDYLAKSNKNYSDYEKSDQIQTAMLDEIELSKHYIEERLDKNVTHFCFPWFMSSPESMEYLNHAGYLAAHLGATNGFKMKRTMRYPILFNRIQEDYLLALPGSDSSSLVKVLKTGYIIADAEVNDSYK